MFKNLLKSDFAKTLLVAAFLIFMCIFITVSSNGCADKNNPGDLVVDLPNNNDPHSIESVPGYNVLVDALLEYDSVYGGFNDGLLMVIKDGKDGFIDKTEKLVIPCEYNALPFSEGLAVVHKYNPDRDDWGFIDTAGNIVIPIIYDWVGSFHNERAVFEDNGKYGLMDNKGNIIVPAEYNNIFVRDEGWNVMKDGLDGIIDKNGEFIVPMGNKYRSSDGLFILEIIDENDVRKCGFADIDDNWIIPPIYNNVDLFHEDLAWVYVYDAEKDSRTNMFIDKTGAVILNINELGYSHCETYFSDGLCLVQKDGKWGFIDKTGSPVIPAVYEIESNPFVLDLPESFHDGRTIVQKGGKYGMIATTGDIIIPIIYDNIRYFQDNDNFNIYNGNVVAMKDGKYGILDYITGNEIVPLIYDDIK